MSFGENLQLRVLQRLPARFYFNASCESSFRYETNVFQFPTKRKLLSQIFQTTPPPIFAQLNVASQQAIRDDFLRLSSRDDLVFRVLPNVTAGWTLAPRTRVFGNFFMIRDSLFHNVRLNTVIYSLAYGVQQDIPVTRRGNLQLEFQARELYQLHQQPLFDFLPAATFSYILTPRTVLFANALLQLRGKRYFQAPTREIDPFYTFGFLHQRGGWSFSNTATLVQNFREPFRANATIPVNNYSWILDFEIARRLIKQLPGLQAFVRAEPIYNFHSHNRPGLAGFDFRLFWGMRFAMGKPALTAALEQIKQQLQEQEAPPPTGPGGRPAEPKPSAFLMPYQLIAGSPQPIHGPLSPSLAEYGGSQPAVAVMPAAYPAYNPPAVTEASYSGPIAQELPAAPTPSIPNTPAETPAVEETAAVAPTPQVASALSPQPAPLVSQPAQAKVMPVQTASAPVESPALTEPPAPIVNQPIQAKVVPVQTASAPVERPVLKTAPTPVAPQVIKDAGGLTPHVANAAPVPAPPNVTETISNSTQPLIAMIPVPAMEPVDDVETESAPEELSPAVAKPENPASAGTTPRSEQSSRQEPPAAITTDTDSEVSLVETIQDDDSAQTVKQPKKKRERKKVTRTETAAEKPVKSEKAQPALKPGHVQMVLIPPLPPVNLKSKDKPFGDSGIELSRPIMMNLVH